MKLVQNLPEIFEEFGEKKREAFLEIKEYKDKGIPVVGMYCAYFPTELAMAVGAIPVGLCSFSNETITAAERDLPKSMCPLVKSSYGFAISDRCPFFHFADLVIGETTCDGKKKMYELMSEFKPVHVMELPNSQSERGLAFWKSEIIRTKEYLEEFFHIVITEEMIRDAVHLNNEIRMSLKNLCELMKLDPAPVKGEDIQKMVQGSKYRFDFATTPGVVKEVIDKIMTEYRQGKHLEKRPRILVTGCPIGGDSLKVIRAIEDNGGVVVAIENCSGVRTLGNPVEEDCEDIYEAIARKYLSTGCSIMTPNDNRIDLIGEIIDEYHVDGVVEMILTGCHATGAESVYIRKFVTEEKHLPYIAVDTDYSTADQGQIATRLTAFLEMIQPGTDEDLDINYCYKIVLAGMTEQRPRAEILEEIWKYTHIPVCIKSGEQETEEWVGISREEAEQECGKRMEYKLSEKNGVVMAVVPEGVNKESVEELLELLAKSYHMRTHTREIEEREVPDYMWIITEEPKNLIYIGRDLTKQARVNKMLTGLKLRQIQDNELFISGMDGKEARNGIIDVCRKSMEDEDGKIMIGNGFSDWGKKEENRQLQWQVLNMAVRQKQKEQVLLVENYYHELAISCISENLGQENIYLEELEILKEEDRKTGKELYKTLYWYLRMKRNVAQTAARLGIHRNTLLPRIARINELLDLDEKDGMECERILMGMEIEKLKND